MVLNQASNIPKNINLNLDIIFQIFKSILNEIG